MRKVIVLIVFFIVHLSACAEECTYSFDGIETPKFSKEELDYSNWNRKDLFIGVLSSGEYVSVKYWACNHFGVQAVLFSPIDETDHVSLKDKILWFASKVLSKDDSKIISDYFSKTNKIMTGITEIPHEMYSEFTITISPGQFSNTITIYFYFS